MYPQINEARALLEEAGRRNPGPWVDHSLVAAECARRIAEACGMNGEKAYVLGLLHDIGRRYGVTGLRHALDGYDYLMELGYDEAARICLNHSFAVQRLDTGIGKLDVTPEEETRMNALLTEMQYDDYDRLGQLVDCVAMAEGPAEMEKRMQDVKNRYGNYPQEKWDKHLELGRYFSEKAGKPISTIIEGVKPE